MKALALALILMVFIICAWFFQQNMQILIASIKGLGILAPLIFIIIYCLATVLLLPTMVLTLAGGAIFGPFAGTLLNLVGATLGASSAFIISRYLAFNWFEQRRGVRLNKLIAGVEQRGWQFVALLRLIPIIPFNLVNYGLGITGIGFKLYVLTTFIFLIPAEIIYTYCGHAGVAVLSNPDAFYKNSGIVGIVVLTLAFSVFKYIKKRQFMLKQQAIKENQPLKPSAGDAQD